jgi:hypothetical protein
MLQHEKGRITKHDDLEELQTSICRCLRISGGA